MSQELTRKLAAAIEGMPAFPASVRKILELARNIDCTPKELIQVIDKDPVLTVRILKVVNSAHYGLAKSSSTVNHAVIFLGFNTVKNLALGIAAIGMLPKSRITGFDTHQCLLHSLTTAGIARLLASRVADTDPFDCFIAGLLHDFGKMALAQFMPNEFRLALELSQEYGLSLHLALRKIVGVDHATIGAVLVERWNFSSALIEAIHHQGEPALAGGSGMAACVFAANQISKKLELGFGGNAHVEDFPPAVAARLGGDLDTVISSLGDLTALYREAQAFARFDEEGLAIG